MSDDIQNLHSSIQQPADHQHPNQRPEGMAYREVNDIRQSGLLRRASNADNTFNQAGLTGLTSSEELLKQLAQTDRTANGAKQTVREAQPAIPAPIYGILDNHPSGPGAELAQGILQQMRMANPGATFTDSQGRVREASILVQGPGGQRPQSMRICYGPDGTPTQLLNQDGSVYAAVGQNGVQSIDINFGRNETTVQVNNLRGLRSQSLSAVGDFDCPPSLRPPHRTRDLSNQNRSEILA
jgi:hypothetical protein